MKTSEEQGLALFPGTEFETCPMLAMALAMQMLTAPSTDVIDNLPDMQDQAAITFSPDVPLLDILDHPADTTGLGAPSAAAVPKTPTVYSCVNRVRDRIAAAGGVTAALTSHSFRRGGAQHANSSGELTARWIFDRGAWNMCTTNKGFNYIFNTSKEGHMVSKILSGHDTNTNVAIQDLRSFDSQTWSTISSFKHHLFSTYHNLQAAQHNVNTLPAELAAKFIDILRTVATARILGAANPEIVHYSYCRLGWGVAGDIAAESEKYPWMGAQRYVKPTVLLS
ncbi:Hypothetical protein PHPALM_1209 [Phytophthora palmivora]|uniref:Uncharacterized protein n=1 Tax=Phytophthora palmivora TaxID=4796 RepID=A0A2P4YSX9_9STRA|nr:Hypothetical protein PHPALM_1209 [Phytophthora palmivora]